jgi:ribosomal protein S18 acetylase RimI-like enzyme
MCASHSNRPEFAYTIGKVANKDERSTIRRLTREFWGEEEQLTFDKRFAMAGLPAYVAKTGHDLVGFVSFAEMSDFLIIVGLGVLPSYQGCGVGTKLVGKVENEARKHGKEGILVSTSNDDLPALAFYQRLGFQICEIKPNVIAEKHGTVLQGIGGLPIRDEIRLRKRIAEAFPSREEHRSL